MFFDQGGCHIPEIMDAMIVSVTDTEEQITPVSVTVAQLNDGRMAQLVKVQATKQELTDAQLQLSLEGYPDKHKLTVIGVLSADINGRILLGATIETEAHTPGEPVQENITATCTEGGTCDEVVYCAVCGEELSRETKTIEALGHLPGEPVKANETDPTSTTSGGYDEVVYCERCGAELSREHTVLGKTINGLLTITKEPQDVTLTVGQKATLTVKATGKSITYQWYYKSPTATKWTKISTGTKAAYTVTGKTTNNGYQYKCVVKNADGTAKSGVAKLTVN